MNNRDFLKRLKRRANLRKGQEDGSFAHSPDQIELFEDTSSISKPSSNFSLKLGIALGELYRIAEKFLSRLRLIFISGLFWGRGTSYKNIAHISIILISALIGVSGLTYTLSSDDSVRALGEDGSVVGSSDLLLQGGTIQTVLQTDSEISNLSTTTHVVKKGETLQSIADRYEVSKDTIRWASSDVVSAFSDEIREGWTLTIPELNGVLYTVKAGETLDSIITEASQSNDEANRFNIIEFNNLTPPYELVEGTKLFIPDGNLKQTFDDAGVIADIPRGVFTDPLSHPACVGYSYSRGFLWYHDGLDLAHPGCPISAVANGTIEYAGWAPFGQGYMVRINHGGGIVTEYFHGNGEMWVKPGQFVRQGDLLMQMGCTGFCTGTHLHFILKKDEIAVDPEGFVPHIKYGVQV